MIDNVGMFFQVFC